jgi:cystathionine beta-lyase
VLSNHAYWKGKDHALIRLHIGLESPRDLIEDLTQAFGKIQHS